MICEDDLVRNDLNENDRKKTGLTASEERVNVNHRWLGTSVVRVRIRAGGLVLLGAGCAVLGWGSRSRQTAAKAALPMSRVAIGEKQATMPSLLATAQSLPGEAAGIQPRTRSLF